MPDHQREVAIGFATREQAVAQDHARAVRPGVHCIARDQLDVGRTPVLGFEPHGSNPAARGNTQRHRPAAHRLLQDSLHALDRRAGGQAALGLAADHAPIDGDKPVARVQARCFGRASCNHRHDADPAIEAETARGILPIGWVILLDSMENETKLRSENTAA